MKPLISIIIPSFNRAHLIGETLDSVLVQTYTHWECIVVDDGSTDNTLKIISEYALKDNRIKYFHRPKDRLKGANACRNYGFELTKGEFVNFFDSDDIMVKNKLEVDLKNISSGDYDFTVSQSDFFEHTSKKILGVWNKNIWSKNPINDFIVMKIGWGINSPLWKKKSLLTIKFDERLQSGQDYLFHIQELSCGLKPYVDYTILVHQRSHSDKIENNINKSPSKAIIFYYLLKNYKTIGYDKNTRVFLIDQSFKVLISLYKTKHWKKAVMFSKQLLELPEKSNYIIKLIKYFIVGSFFNVTMKGYRFLR